MVHLGAGLWTLLILSFQASPTLPQTPTLTEFENGLKLLVLPLPDQKLVQVDVYLSLRGGGDRTDIAHLVEHLMFRSSENCPAGSLADSLLLLTTFNNGFTSPRNINTRSRCLPQMLPRLLMVEAERLGRLKPDQKDLDTEKIRILGEHDLIQDADIGSALSFMAIGLAYGGRQSWDHQFGNPSAVRAADLAEVDGFISHLMQPHRMALLVSGPVDPAQVAALAESSFGSLSNQREPSEPPSPPQPVARKFVTTSLEESDHLVVGFRLPYASTEEVAIVHLAETIMDRENGHPVLWVFEDEAFLALQVVGNWSTHRTEDEAADKALEQFWDETRTVYHRVRDDWYFEKNRQAHVKDLRLRLSRPRLAAEWLAQGLADDRDLPSLEMMTSMIDSLDHAVISKFFKEQFTPETAFVAFAAGRPPSGGLFPAWYRYQKFYLNPYLARAWEEPTLSRPDIDPLLESAAGLGGAGAMRLVNGVPILVLPLPGEEEVFMGGVRTFYALHEEARSRSPGQLIVYQNLVNFGYDQKGTAIPPIGAEPGWDTWVDAQINSVVITSHGPAGKWDQVAEAMHKRMTIDHLDPYAFRWLIRERNEIVKQYRNFPGIESLAWLIDTVYGADHPAAGWFRPDPGKMEDFTYGKANKMHRHLFRTGNLQLVIAGDVDESSIPRVLEKTLADLDQANPGFYPLLSGQDFGITGRTFHDNTTEVATLEFMFPPIYRDSKFPWDPVDLMVMEILVDRRLGSTMSVSGLDSVFVSTFLYPAGPSALPRITILCTPEDAPVAFDLVQKEIPRLRAEPPDETEEALARLRLVGYLAECLQDPQSARDLYLAMGRFGPIPGDPLGNLNQRPYGLMPSRLGSVFPSRRYAWTITSDTTLTTIDQAK